jgi:predicted nuclease of predicted toxin-antitoxin system
VKILVDMNLSPEWLQVLAQAGWEAKHWSTVNSKIPAGSDCVARES